MDTVVWEDKQKDKCGCKWNQSIEKWNQSIEKWNQLIEEDSEHTPDWCRGVGAACGERKSCIIGNLGKCTCAPAKVGRVKHILAISMKVRGGGKAALRSDTSTSGGGSP